MVEFFRNQRVDEVKELSEFLQRLSPRLREPQVSPITTAAQTYVRDGAPSQAFASSYLALLFN